MTRSRLRFAPSLFVLIIGLGACQAGASSPSASLEPSESAAPSPAAPSETASAEATPSPATTPTDGGASASPPSPAGGFAIAPNAAADALFTERDDCANPAGGYRLEFPDAWWTNTAFGDLEPCVWFSPTTFDVSGAATPAEIAIVVDYVEGDVGFLDEVVSREDGRVGVTQDAVRVELRGAGGTGGTMPAEWRQYAYVVQLGPTPEEGPNLLVRTDTDMGGDYELNKAVLDRIMATIEFVGSID